MRVRVLIADDHALFLQGLKGLLERESLRVIALAMDGREAVALARRHRPAVAILDLSMPLLNGLDAARQIGKVSPGTRKILLTHHVDERYIFEAIRAGVDAYVPKTKTGTELVAVIRDVLAGTYTLEAEGEPVGGVLDPLSGREREVLQLIAEAKTSREIAALLGVGVKTVETHRMRLMGKLGIHQRAGLVRYAVRRGLIQA